MWLIVDDPISWNALNDKDNQERLLQDLEWQEHQCWLHDEPLGGEG